MHPIAPGKSILFLKLTITTTVAVCVIIFLKCMEKKGFFRFSPHQKIQNSIAIGVPTALCVVCNGIFFKNFSRNQKIAHSYLKVAKTLKVTRSLDTNSHLLDQDLSMIEELDLSSGQTKNASLQFTKALVEKNPKLKKVYFPGCSVNLEKKELMFIDITSCLIASAKWMEEIESCSFYGCCWKDLDSKMEEILKKPKQLKSLDLSCTSASGRILSSPLLKGLERLDCIDCSNISKEQIIAFLKRDDLDPLLTVELRIQSEELDFYRTALTKINFESENIYQLKRKNLMDSTPLDFRSIE